MSDRLPVHEYGPRTTRSSRKARAREVSSLQCFQRRRRLEPAGQCYSSRCLFGSFSRSSIWVSRWIPLHTLGTYLLDNSQGYKGTTIFAQHSQCGQNHLRAILNSRNQEAFHLRNRELQTHGWSVNSITCLFKLSPGALCLRRSSTLTTDAHL